MRTGYLTQNQLIALKLMIGKDLIVSKRLKQLISDDEGSAEKLAMLEGDKYYRCEHDILTAERFYYVQGRKVEQKGMANNRVPIGHHNIIVDQKAEYIVGNPVSIGVKKISPADPNTPTDAEQKAIDTSARLEGRVKALFGRSINTFLSTIVKSSSNHGVDWVHIYIDEDGKFGYLPLSGVGIIPVYDSTYGEKIVGIIRYYEFDFIDENTETTTQRLKVEWWNDETVEYYAENKQGDLVHDPDVYLPENGAMITAGPLPHWDIENNVRGNRSGSWGMVPFIPLWNNDLGMTDLQPIKGLIDAFDKVENGWLNDFEDLQEVIFILKGFEALNAPEEPGYEGLSDLGKFIHNLKEHKVITVTEDGSVDKLLIPIPYEMKKELLGIIRKQIYIHGKGIDIDPDKFGNAPSGVALKFLYSLLDLKANEVLRSLDEVLYTMMVFFARYLKDSESMVVNPDDITFTFSKATIVNEKEIIDGIIASEGKGIVSRKTLREKHPWVSDPEAEAKQIEREAQEDVERGIVDLNSVPDEQTPEDGGAQ